MRWVLAGLAFALLVGLAVLTVALRTRNLAARARIAGHDQQIMALRVEAAKRALRPRRGDSTARLLERLRRLRRALAGTDQD